jgi:hypothetical protein
VFHPVGVFPVNESGMWESLAQPRFGLAPTIRLRESRLRLRRSGFRRSRVEPMVGVTRIRVDLRVGENDSLL